MDGHELDLSSIVSFLRRQLSLIALVFVVIAGGATIFVLLLPRIYTASALIIVEPGRRDLLSSEVEAAPGSFDGERVESEVELARSDATLIRAVRRAGLVEDQEFGPGFGWRDRLAGLFGFGSGEPLSGEAAEHAAMAKLRGAVVAKRRGLTSLIAVEASSRDPHRAALLANTVAAVHIDGQLEAKVDAVLAAREVLNSRIADANAAVVASEEAFDRFIDANISTIVSETGQGELTSLRNEIERSMTEHRRLGALVAAASGNPERPEPGALLGTTEAGKSLAIGGSSGGAAEGGGRDGELAAGLGADLAELRRQMDAEQARIAELRVRLREGVLRSNLPASILASMYAMQQSAEIARAQYQMLLARSKDLEIRSYLQVTDSRIASPALAPISPSSPDPPPTITLFAVLGLAAGLCLAFVRENIVGGFTSEGQVQAVLKTGPVVPVPRPVTIPRGPDGTEAVTLADDLVLAPLSAYAEAVRQLRVRVDQAMQRRQQRQAADAPQRGQVVLVTSPVAGDGKTTIALSLARAYALSGRRTLLIDADLRKPEVHVHLGLEPSNGLFEFLAGTHSPEMLQSVLTTDPLTPAKVVVGSRPSGVPTDHFIAGPTFLRLLQGAMDNFDVVVLDTPPLTPVVDAHYLARSADVVVFAVRWARTSQVEARRAIQALTQAARPETEVVVALSQQWVSRPRRKVPYGAPARAH